MPPKIPMTITRKRKYPKHNREFATRKNYCYLRKVTLKRDHYICQSCLEVYHESNLECDHIIPLQQGGPDNSSNTQTLCIPCHAIKTQRERG